MATSKKKEKLRLQNQITSKNQIRLTRVLKATNLLDVYRRLPLKFRESFVATFDLPPLYTFSPRVPTQIKARLDETLSSLDLPISWEDFQQIIQPLASRIYSRSHEEPPSKLPHLAQATGLQRIPPLSRVDYNHCLSVYRTYYKLFTEKLLIPVLQTCVEKSSPDSQFIGLNIQEKKMSRGRYQIHLAFDAVPAQITRVLVKGRVQNAYRLGRFQPKSGFEMDWLTKKPLDLGLTGSFSETLPVYVQVHALRRAKERLDHPGAFDLFTALIFDSIRSIPSVTQSQIGKPSAGVIVFPNESASLIPFKVETGLKIGYLLVTRTPSAIIVHTFILLTMGRSPEGRALTEKFQMRWRDFDYLELDRLSTFTKSDIADNPQLRPIFDSAGFKDFLDWAKKLSQGEVLKPLAQEMIDYYMLNDHLSYADWGEKTFLSQDENNELQPSCCLSP
jgi:hypothetical protein